MRSNELALCKSRQSTRDATRVEKCAKKKKSSYFIGVSIGVNGVAGVASVTRNSITFCVSPIQKHLPSDLIFALLSESNANWEWAGNQLRARTASCIVRPWASCRQRQQADDVLFAKATDWRPSGELGNAKHIIGLAAAPPAASATA